MKLPHVEPSPRHLQRAYNQLRLPGWPGTLDAALSDRICSRLIRGLAVNYAREELRTDRKPPSPMRTGPVIGTGLPQRRHATPFDRHFDPKRLAANDRDD